LFGFAICGSIFYGGTGAIAGAAYGFIKSQVAEGNAEEYYIGVNDWHIVLE